MQQKISCRFLDHVEVLKSYGVNTLCNISMKLLEILDNSESTFPASTVWTELPY